VNGRWVAGAVRAKALAGRRIGRAAARGVAASPTLDAAVLALVGTSYGRGVQVGDDLGHAQHGVWATLLWHLRVAAGWQPAAGAAMARVLAAGFQIANATDGGRYELGGLARRYQWDRGAALTRQLGWARTVAAAVPAAADWAAGAVAVLVATQSFLVDRPLSDEQRAQARPLLGTDVSTGSFAEFARRLPAAGRWALADVDKPEDLGQAERAWWHRVERDGFRLLHDSRFGPDPFVGAVGVLAVDAWRVRAALEVAARGGRDLEAFDAVV
jgi:hypothetical protein